jgi:hypothetical protein
MFKLVTLLTLICFSIVSYGQLPAKQVNAVALKTEVYGGVLLHTGGWGANIVYTKFLTNKTKRMFTLDVLNMKHSKEIKIQGYVDQNSKDFVFGKLNGLFIVRAGYGKKYTAYEKLREKGVNIFWNWNIGPSLGFLKPVYLDVVNLTPSGRISTPLQEPYNPEKHNLGNIYGRSKGIRGLAETKITPGAFVKLGLEFEYNDDREFIKALGVGATLDIYPKEMNIMAYAKNTFIFPSLYINVLIGKRYF